MLESSNRRREEMTGKGGDDSLRTVECLRGRLLAERAASKAAKGEAELLAERLAVLERQLAEEIKYRDRAEKRLKYALKKLKSLKLLDVSSQLSDSSVSSSSACFSGHRSLEGQKSDVQVTDSGGCGSMETRLEQFGLEDVGYVGSVDSSGGSPGQFVSQEGSWSSVGTAHSHNKKESHEEETKSQQLAIVRQSGVSDNELDCEKHQSETEHNPLALVPAGMWPSSGVCRPEIKHDVQGVLLALHHVKERLQSSVGRRAVLSSAKELYGQ